MTAQPPPTLSPATSGIQVKLTTIHDPLCIDLIARQRDEIRLIYPALTSNTAVIPFFMVLIRDGKSIACGGLRLIEDDDSIAEIKRVYVVPEARGQANGVADLLLKELESHALSYGWTTLRLTTAKTMVAANRFYERHGYRLVPGYGEYTKSFFSNCYEKVIA